MSDHLKLARLADVPVELCFEMARFDITVQALLELREGSMISPPATSMDTVRIIADGQALAHGEVVTQEQCYGVRFSRYLPAAAEREAVE